MAPEQDFRHAIKNYSPVAALLCVSGGHDSISAATFAAPILKDAGIPMMMYHGDTGTGIAETREYVEKMAERYLFRLAVRSPQAPYRYQDWVKKYGFPGPAKHQEMMRNLKQKPLRYFITHEVKSSPRKRENVLLVTGIRSDESLIRMGYRDSIKKDDSRVWTAPIMDWSAADCRDWMREQKIPTNPVKDRICISGECLCGCFAKPEEAAEIKAAYPKSWAKIEALQQYSTWRWGTSPGSWKKNNPPGVINMFSGEANPTDFFCRKCEVSASTGISCG